MTLDNTSLLLVLALINLIMAGALWVAFSGEFRNGLGLWGGSLLVQAGAWGLFMVSKVAGHGGAVIAGHILLSSSFMLQAGSMVELRKARLNLAGLISLPVLMGIVGALLVAHPRAEGAMVNLMQALGCATIIWQLTREKLHHQPRTIGLMVCAYALLFIDLVALAMFSVFSAEPDFLADPGQWSGVCVLAAIASVVLTSFGFLLMHKERAENEMHRLATMDPLTGVFNRRTFIELAERELARCRRSASPLRLLMLDLDHFKRINDTRGHLVGDDVIREFANTVGGCLRREDLLVRYGGEEFCVLLPGADASTALTLADRIRATVDKTMLQTRSGPVHVTTSIGVCGDDAGEIENLESLISGADNALYLAKAAGRNQVVSSLYSKDIPKLNPHEVNV